MFQTEDVPLVERGRLANEYFSLRQRTESVMDITKMFTERALFCPDYSTLKHAQML